MKKWYLAVGAVSLLFLAPLLVYDITKWKEVLAAVGESGIAAILIALLIEEWQRRDRRRKKDVYLNRFRQELLYLLGRMVWFDERVSDKTFNWGLPVETYWTKRYAIQALTKNPGRQMSWQAVQSWIKDFKTRYSTDAVAAMSGPDQACTVQMFRIVAAGSKGLPMCAGEMTGQRLSLAAEGILTLEQVSTISSNVGFIMGILLDGARTVKNYGLVPQLVVETYRLVDDQLLETKGISVDLHCTISYSEI